MPTRKQKPRKRFQKIIFIKAIINTQPIVAKKTPNKKQLQTAISIIKSIVKYINQYCMTRLSMTQSIDNVRKRL